MSETVMAKRRMWPTPNAMDATPMRLRELPDEWRAQRDRHAAIGNNKQYPLTVAVKEDWPSNLVVRDASNQLTLFAEAFPVSPIVSPADAAPVPTTATSGPSSPELFASCNPDGSWRKTYQDCSPVRLDGSSVPFSETWPRAGMTRSGTAYRLQPSAPLTDATASGSWPTPQAEDSHHGGRSAAPRQILKRIAEGRQLDLQQVVKMQMWPTPCAEDAKNVPYQKGDGGKRYPMLLGAVAPERMWPSPNALDWKNRGSLEYREGRQIQLQTAVNGQLNPTWVEWLMGYPLGWTALEDSAIASYRQSQRGSRGASSPPKA